MVVRYWRRLGVGFHDRNAGFAVEKITQQASGITHHFHVSPSRITESSTMNVLVTGSRGRIGTLCCARSAGCWPGVCGVDCCLRPSAGGALSVRRSDRCRPGLSGGGVGAAGCGGAHGGLAQRRDGARYAHLWRQCVRDIQSLQGLRRPGREACCSRPRRIRSTALPVRRRSTRRWTRRIRCGPSTATPSPRSRARLRPTFSCRITA